MRAIIFKESIERLGDNKKEVSQRMYQKDKEMEAR